MTNCERKVFSPVIEKNGIEYLNIDKINLYYLYRQFSWRISWPYFFLEKWLTFLIMTLQFCEWLWSKEIFLLQPAAECQNFSPFLDLNINFRSCVKTGTYCNVCSYLSHNSKFILLQGQIFVVKDPPLVGRTVDYWWFGYILRAGMIIYLWERQNIVSYTPTLSAGYRNISSMQNHMHRYIYTVFNIFLWL